MRLSIDLHHDLRYTFRRLRKSPGFTLLAAGTLALGIGASTADFATMDALLLRPMPGISEPRALAAIREYNEHERAFTAFSYPNYRYYRDHARSFTRLTAWTTVEAYTSVPKPQPIVVALVSSNYFDLLGVRLSAGRSFTPDEEGEPGKHPVVVVSYAFWTSRLNADPGVIDKPITIDRTRFTVIGIAPRRFRGVELFDQIDIWTPVSMFATFQRGLTQTNLLADESERQFVVLGRLARGFRLTQAQIEFDVLASRLDRATPRKEKKTRVLIDRHTGVEPAFRGDLTRLASVELPAAVLLLLIATSNVASMLLARAAGSAKEVAVRLALGASRGRVVRQLLVESVTVAAIGGTAGVFVAVWLTELTRSLLPSDLPPDMVALRPDRLLVLVTTAAILAGILCGLAPACHTGTADLWGRLMRGSSGGATLRFSAVRRALIVGQIALSVILLVGSGLLLQALRNSYQADLGYRTDGLLLSSIDLRRQGYSEARAATFGRDLLARIEAVPGVRAATIARSAPVAFFNWTEDIEVEGRRLTVGKNVVAANYFRTLEIALIAGRDFSVQDREGTPAVAVVNQALAKRLWPAQNAIGRRLRILREVGPPIPVDVIGVSRDAVHGEFNEGAQPWLYLPLSQHTETELVLQVRSIPGSSVAAGVLAAVGSLDPDLFVDPLKPFEQHLRDFLVFRRLVTFCVALYGAMALLMAATGLFGVISYSAAQRSRELGIRMVFGADRLQVVAMVLRESALIAALGTVLGAGASFPLSQSLQSFLYSVQSLDLLTYAVVTLVVVSVALLASLAPALRAAQLDPAVILRED